MDHGVSSKVVSAETTSLPFLALLLLIVVAAFVYLSTQNIGEAPKGGKSNKNFLVPEKGGALQLMPKNQDGNVSLKLTQKIKVSGDTYIFRFGFADESMVLGLPIGKHVVMEATIPTNDEPNGESVERKYTPISEVTQRGHVDFLIKIYRSGVHPKFPEGGLMTQHLERMEVGESMLMSGPKGRL